MTTSTLDDRERTELAKAAATMECPPWFFAAKDPPDKRLSQALKLVEEGRVLALPDANMYQVKGSKTTYTLSGSGPCTCGAAAHGQSQICYHRVSVKLYQELQRRLAPLGQQPTLGLPPSTAEERLAQGPLPPAEEAIPMEDRALPEELPEVPDAAEVSVEEAVMPPPSACPDASEPHRFSAASRMLRSCQVGQLIAALVRAQAQIRNPRLDATNPHFRVKYASLAAVRDAVTPALAAHGLTITQFPSTEQGAVTCETVLWHVSGQYLGNVLRVPVAKQDAQGYGAALTYARRYGLMALCNVVGDEDDDAEEDTHPVRPQADARNPHPVLDQIRQLLRQAGRSDELISSYWRRTCERCKVDRPEDIPIEWQARLLDEVQARLAKAREEPS